MASDNLPSEFDVVILGTGLSESVIAAACSRVGQRVLHLDRRNYYAGNWASFTFSGLLSWIEQYKTQQEASEEEQGWRDKLEEGEEALLLSSSDSSITNLDVFSYASEENEEEADTNPPALMNTETETEVKCDGPTEAADAITPINGTQTPAEQQGQEGGASETKEEEQSEGQVTDQSESEEKQPISNVTEPPVEVKKKITYAKLVKEGRRFNIDLVSKLMYSRGSLVELLIKSNVSRYAEFKNITRILTYRNGKVEQVPCSRADVFGSKQLTVVEKRVLMKFLTFCLDYEQHPEEYQDYTERPFLEFLQTKKLTENLQHFVLHSIAMVTTEALTQEGLKATQHFLRCLGRYGNTPFLFPLYGLGEVPQCFCRMCAVFGGIYCLRHSVQCLVLDKESGKCKAVIDTHGQRISCSHFVVEDGYVRDEQRKSTAHRHISRAILITDRSVLLSESEQQISLVTVPPLEPNGPAVRMIELCSSSMTCMPGTYLVHLTCSSTSTARNDLEPVISKMFHVPAGPGEESKEGEETERPTLLWVMYFNLRDTSGLDTSSYELPANVHVCTGPDAGLGSDYSINMAEAVFHKLLPDEEFCPPAPNPEDIIYDGEGPQGEGAGFEDTAQSEETANGEGSEAEEHQSREGGGGKTDSLTDETVPDTEDVQSPPTEE